ncbi:hypothetical protein QAD02_020618 [Eretmocerus hayati]|uniref:Uncharacterized protein n=1 Tax=Eretmocerus hayati TaxID=131215 RepID=A0ACC2PSR4_9HYME|nr:hypothetical protein QAD02_020618 [Eretmocerus hayati]
MVTLFVPFGNEELDILPERKFMSLYDSHEECIVRECMRFESDLDHQKTIDICRELCRGDDGIEDETEEGHALLQPDVDPFVESYHNPNSIINEDLVRVVIDRLGAVSKKRENIMTKDDYNARVRTKNNKQRQLVMHVIYHCLAKENTDPLVIFLTGPAGWKWRNIPDSDSHGKHQSFLQ